MTLVQFLPITDLFTRWKSQGLYHSKGTLVLFLIPAFILALNLYSTSSSPYEYLRLPQDTPVARLPAAPLGSLSLWIFAQGLASST